MTGDRICVLHPSVYRDECRLRNQIFLIIERLPPAAKRRFILARGPLQNVVNLKIKLHGKGD